jgi:hypothetical protein
LLAQPNAGLRFVAMAAGLDEPTLGDANGTAQAQLAVDENATRPVMAADERHGGVQGLRGGRDEIGKREI